MEEEFEKEIWKDIIGYEGSYQVSNHGRVRSLDRIVISKNTTRKILGRILKINLYPNGYEYVQLQKDGKRKSCLVHRLIAVAFIPNPKNLPIINHKNKRITWKHIEIDKELLELCNKIRKERYKKYFNKERKNNEI